MALFFATLIFLVYRGIGPLALQIFSFFHSSFAAFRRLIRFFLLKEKVGFLFFWSWWCHRDTPEPKSLAQLLLLHVTHSLMASWTLLQLVIDAEKSDKAGDF